jgi:transcriptional regulator with XRE-family HTH domain
MGRQKWTDERFGKKVRTLRESRRWSQAEVAKMLLDKGIQPMHPTTVAKIETGDRSVRINEAAAIADLFNVSLDSLLGREIVNEGDDLAYRLGILVASAHESYLLVGPVMRTVQEPLEELPGDFEGADDLQEMGNKALSHLKSARKALAELVSASRDFLQRE